MTLLEVCLDDVDGAILAERSGADRIELCAGLGEGGTTPSLGTVSTVLASLSRIAVRVLIRQRPGDFVYSPAELEAMCADIEAIAALSRPSGVELGFVVGALTPAGEIDSPALERMRAAAGTAPLTFHKAFDLTPDLGDSLELVIEAGVDRVLTSGAAPSASEGAEALAGLVEQAAGRITILAGGGIRAHNAADVVARSGVAEVHFKALAPVASASLRSGVPNDYDPGSRPATSADLIADMMRALGRERVAQ